MTKRETDDAGYAPYADGAHPPYYFERYQSSTRRAPARPLFEPPRTLSELTGPVFLKDEVLPDENDLSTGRDGRPVLGQLMIVTGRVLDEDERPVPGTLVELWQANTAGKYNHPADEFHAPVDPNFTGCGRCMTDVDGRYGFQDDQARRVSGPAHRQLVAAAAHPFFAVRPDLPDPARDPDVFSRASR